MKFLVIIALVALKLAQSVRRDQGGRGEHLRTDPGYNRRLDAALRLRSPARKIALGRLDAHVARTAAPWAALANERGYDFFSARVGRQVYNLAFGIELGGLCIRRDE